MYRWKCLEKIAGGHHKCDLACLVDDDENEKKATAIKRQHDSLSRLYDGFKSSTVAFADPEGGFRQLVALVDNVCRVLKETYTEFLPLKAADILESIHLRSIYQLLFHDQRLLLQTSVYLQLDIIGQKIIIKEASILWDELLHCLGRIREGGGDNAAAALLGIMNTGNQTLKDAIRLYLLQSPAFYNPDILKQFPKSRFAVDLGLADDAELRAKNMTLRPDLFQSGTDGSGRHDGQQCSVCVADEEVVSGKIKDGDNDDFLTFPGKLNNIRIKPLIDTGGGCNLVKLEWIRAQGIEIDAASSRSQTLLMADGSESKSCPVIDVKWSFDGRNKAWVDVEFVVVEGYKYDALIGLPFLKHTETIHNSAGRLVFPEFKGAHAKKEAIPLYNFSKLSASK